VFLALADMAPARAASAPCPRFEIALVRTNASAETRPVHWNGRTIHVDQTPIIAMDDITEAKLGDPDSLQAEALQLKFRPDAAARLEHITADPKGVRVATVLDDVALLNVFFSGGYGVGPQGMQISPGDPDTVKGLPETINRCSAAIAAR
jgi:preprotein translocase subunit SecD